MNVKADDGFCYCHEDSFKMASAASGLGGLSCGQLIRTFERLFEDAQITGELKLSGKKLKEFPKVACKYDLSDTVVVDLSKNRFSEVPSEICEFYLLERLDCYHNTIRSIPDSVITLHSLTYLDLSRNQLTSVSPVLCQLPLQVLILSNNKLVALPEEIGHMQCLMDLDISCNEISNIPPQIGDLHSLCTLNMRRNLITKLPSELCELQLAYLNISANRIAILPTSLRLMISLQILVVDQNPLTCPPAILCTRGKVHIFKFLELQASKEDKKQDILLENDLKRMYRKPGYIVDLRFQNGLPIENKVKRCTVDSGYNTSDGGEKRRSQEIQDLNIDLEETRSMKTYKSTNENQFSKSNNILNSFDLNEHISISNNLIKQEQNKRNEKFSVEYLNGKSPINKNTNKINKEDFSKKYLSITRLSSSDSNVADDDCKFGNLSVSGENKRPYPHIQTYKEYKEALRLQRAGDNNIYKKVTVDGTTSLTSNKNEGFKVETNVQHHTVTSHLTPEEEFRVKHETLKNQQRHEAEIIQRHIESERNKFKEICKDQNSVVQQSQNQKIVSSKAKCSSKWERSNNDSAKSVSEIIHPHFTMRRELDKAREEQELIEKLREIIETKLEITLPEDLSSSLMDGVLLCRLANYVFPNSVASVHVPSVSVPKLTMAKCRKNVESFLEACQSSGVPQELICSSQDVLEERGGLVRVSITVQELLKQTEQ
ncbi:leucine-rich repeat and calponin homology domain-containing protein-like isoform X2 [Centruroides vittatus]|uniref:leucine-rich repeat and calponin homology domain-containing protein-like isoform X2 n=1 Tax=Centruroides vittatus TaxID=120091 RepID=UPI00350EFA7F